MQRLGKRKRQNVVDSAGLDWARPAGIESKEPALRVQGFACTLFESSNFDPEEHLIAWSGDESTQTDRFDGRLLLESLKTGADSSLPLAADAGDASEEELVAERYADLDYSREEELASVAGWYHPNYIEAVAEEDGASQFGTGANMQPLSAVRFSYGPQADQAEAVDALVESTAGKREEAPFEPTFAIPEGLTPPKTARMHKIIAQTAKFVRGVGRQSVFVLRVKQAQNPNFTFLMPHDQLHPYFEWLLDNNPSEDTSTVPSGGPPAAQEPAEASKDAGNALGLLSSYGSDSISTPTAAQSAHSSDSAPMDSPQRQASDSQGQGTPSTASAEQTTAETLLRSQPPADLQLIIGKLVKYLGQQKHAANFELSLRQREQDNPRFAFLHPGHQHHWFYREEVARTLGREQADAILPPETQPWKPAVTMSLGAPRPSALTLSTSMADAQLAAAAQKRRAAAAKHKSGAQPASLLSQSAIRANPSMVKVAVRPLTEDRAAELAATGTGAQQPVLDASDAAAGERKLRPSRPEQQGPSMQRSQAGGTDPRKQTAAAENAAPSVLGTGSFGVVDSDEDFLKATAGPVRATTGPVMTTAGPATATAGPVTATAGPVTAATGPVTASAEHATANDGPVGKPPAQPVSDDAEVDAAVDELELLETEDTAARDAATRAAEEDRKAQRRRLAKELLLARKAQQQSQQDKDRKWLSHKIVDLRSAFLGGEEEHPTSHLGEAPEPGEVAEGLVRHRAAAPLPQQLPKLEELLQAKRPKQSANSMQDFEVLSPERKVKVSSGSKREPARKRSASLSSDSGSSSDSDHSRRRRRRRRRSKSRDRSGSARHARSYSGGEKKRRRSGSEKGSKKARQRSRSSSSERERGPNPAEQSDLMRDRIRAMLRGS